MSQLIVELHERTPLAYRDAAAAVMWEEAPFPRKHFNWFQYRGLVRQETEDTRSLVCTCNGMFVGGLTIGELGYDIHYPGLGIIVYNTVVRKHYPQATRLLYRELIRLIRKGGGQWYQTTQRVNELELSTKFRRIHGQENS